MADSTTCPARKRPFPILVVDYNADYQFLIKHCLQIAIPYTKATSFSTSQEVIEFLQEAKGRPIDFPKLVFLDIYLPSSDVGYKLLKTIRLAYPTLPVIVLSAFQDPAHIRQAYDVGAHSCMGKPYNFKDLIRDFQTLYTYWVGTVTLPSLE